MSDPTKRAISGAPLNIPAAAFNSFTDAAVARKRARAQATTSSTPDTREGLILVRNDSGHDVARFGILGIADILIDPSANLPEFQNRPAISGATPTTADFAGLFVITAEPIASGKLGQAYVFGYCAVLVNVVSPGDGFADVKNNDRTQLNSSATGGAAQILWMEDISATGQMWCLVRLGNAPLQVVRVRPTATCTKSGTYTGFIRNAPTGAFDSTAAGTLAASDFGSNGAACTIINASEEGLTSSHEITFDGSYLPLEFIGYVIGTDTGTGNPLVMAFMDQSEFCAT